MTFVGQKARKTSRTVLTSVLTLAGMTLMTGNAFAVSMRVQIACARDYYAHCSAYSPTSPQTRACMSAVGAGLSKGCISALISAGEVSSAEVARRRGATQTASK